MPEPLERLLLRVQKPARYVGGEFNEVVKDLSDVKLRMAFCFPDIYEIGMSNLGMQILYGAINAEPDIWCERVFAPWGDMAQEMRAHGVPLYALESGDALDKFDVLGFSLGYEMAYCTVLDMLDMAGIPLRSADRPQLSPLVFAGGTSCCNPEPMAPFFDLMVLGEGEEVDIEVLRLFQRARDLGWSKRDFLLEAAKIPGVYVPGLYEPRYNADGTLAELACLPGAPETVTKRIVEDLDAAFYPTKPVVPSTEIVHDRVNLELFRGCVRGCRFCQAGYVYRPIRARSAEKVVELGRETLKNTGSQEATLLSLSSSDYRHLTAACDGLLDWCEPRSISLSLPSLRADNFSMELMSRLQKVRRGGLTFAPEAGTQRLRDVINKNVTEEELLNTCRIAFEGGWNGIKLYFMLGLPTETDEDVLGIAELAAKVLHVWREYSPNKQRGVRITVSTSCFVPKPHSPFQWEAQVTRAEYKRRVELLRHAITAKNVTYNWHDADMSLIEAALSRGDRRVGAAIENAWRRGARLEAWSDYFDFNRWLDAFAECGLDPEFYAVRERSEDECLPWSRVNMGVRTELLLRERHRAYDAQLSPDCRAECSACGAAALLPKGVKCDG
ncbi:MAG TPA: TIGR03960 family B12-binding radical SAM protein [Candidatus Scatomorpha stercorigallinarum]|nr:TIGR03960 family B12-binding radical SAM protein [Candidatus Scatomorpha stercorigallinarum]